MDSRLRSYIGVPDIEAADSVDAGVVALKSRSIPPDDAIGQSLRALDWLQSQGAEQIVFKYCSTFDSTAQGNIGPVAEALAERLGARGVVACPAFPENGRTVYQGHLFVHDKLLSESGLENHPLTPMTDPDLRRWLRAQTRSSVGHVPLPIVRAGEATVAHAIAECAAAGDVLVITDAVDEAISQQSALPWRIVRWSREARPSPRLLREISPMQGGAVDQLIMRWRLMAWELFSPEAAPMRHADKSRFMRTSTL